MEKILIVKAGGYGALSAAEGSYDSFVDILRDVIEEAEKEGYRGMREKVATVEIVDTTEKVAEKLLMENINTVVFVSRGMLEVARVLKAQSRRLKVVVFTGLIPEDEVILVSKGWMLGREEIQKILL